MSLSTRSIYTLDPDKKKITFAIEVTPGGWTDDQLKLVLQELVPALRKAAISLALLVSESRSFVIRLDQETGEAEFEELPSAEVVSPFAIETDPAQLFPTVERWIRELSSRWQVFAAETPLAKRVPELVPLVANARLFIRESPIGPKDNSIRPPQNL